MDCPKLTEQDIKAYGEAYEHIKDFKTVHKRQLAKFIAEEERKKLFEQLKAEWEEKYEAGE